MQGQYILTIDYPRETFQSIVDWLRFPKIWLAIRTLVLALFGGFQFIWEQYKNTIFNNEFDCCNHFLLHPINNDLLWVFYLQAYLHEVWCSGVWVVGASTTTVGLGSRPPPRLGLATSPLVMNQNYSWWLEVLICRWTRPARDVLKKDLQQFRVRWFPQKMSFGH